MLTITTTHTSTMCYATTTITSRRNDGIVAAVDNYAPVILNGMPQIISSNCTE